MFPGANHRLSGAKISKPTEHKSVGMRSRNFITVALLVMVSDIITHFHALICGPIILALGDTVPYSAY